VRILGINVDFLENIKFSTKRYSIWWVLLLVTILLDILTTNAFIAKYGMRAEGNLITRFLMLDLNPFYGNIIGKILQLFSVLFFVGLNKRFGNIFLLFVNLLNCWAIVVNSWSLSG